LSAHYVLGNNINASETETWNSGAGFTPIGNGVEFSGDFDGQGYSVDGLYINRPNTNGVGLFGGISSSDIKNIGVTNIDIQGGYNVGGLVGFTLDGANIMKSYSSGAVSGNDSVGGLVGVNTNKIIEKSYTNSNVSGDDQVGGLVGENRYLGYIKTSYSLGSVTGNTNVGGLVGDNIATVKDSSYWNIETSNQSTSAGSATGLTTAEITRTIPLGFYHKVYVMNRILRVFIFSLLIAVLFSSAPVMAQSNETVTSDILTRPKGRGFLQGKPRRRRFQN
jgi:hypothetical protein